MKLKPLPARSRAAPVVTATAENDGASPTDTVATEFAAVPGTPEMADARPVSEVRGLIDNATPDRLYGWAWDALHPGTRLQVELRLAGEVVARTIADFPRPDLAKNGIGDGKHAFEFALIPDWVDRHRELTVAAFGVDGSEFPIAVRIRRLDDAQVATQLQKLVETAMAEQQSLRDDFAALREQAQALPQASAVAAVAASQADLAEKVRALEIWLARLDGKLSEAQRLPEPTAGGMRLDPWQAALIATLASVGSAALALSIARNFLMFG